MEDRSIGKETRIFLPFFDRLGLQDLLVDQDDAETQLATQELVAQMAQGASQASATVPFSQFIAKGEPLMTVAAPAAPDSGPSGLALPAGHGPHQLTPHAGVMAKPPLSQKEDGAGSVKVGESSGSIHSHNQGGSSTEYGSLARTSGGREAKQKVDDRDSDIARQDETDEDISVSIDQDVWVDQDTDVLVSISGSADVEISASADVMIDQTALIDLDIVQKPGLAALATAPGALPAVSGPDAPAVPAATSGNIDHDGVNDIGIAVSQDVDIDTFVHVDINGFDGEIFIKTNIGEVSDIDQIARPLVVLDGDGGGFDLEISQFLDIDLLSNIDIDISEDNGRLFITVSVLDRANGTDTASVDFTDSEDDILDIDLRQSIAVDQQVVVHVDVEQELAALFDIDVDVDADLDVGIRQDVTAAVGIELHAEVDIDVKGDSDVQIANELNIRIDFTAS